MQVDLNDKCAIVTGSAGGIGRAIAELLLKNGAGVVIADVREEEGERTTEELSALGTCRFVPTDIADRAAVEKMTEFAIAHFGRIDILINNAGIGTLGAARVDIDEFSPELWQKIVDVDLTGTFHCSQCVSRQMIRAGTGGSIVNIGSVLGSVPARKQIAYNAAKAGVHNMTQSMALELAPYKIRVNAVAPGSTLTDATRTLFYSNEGSHAEFRERMLSHVPLARAGEPGDIANAVVFLVSDDSSYITGQVLAVDGGWTCGFSRDF